MSAPSDDTPRRAVARTAAAVLVLWLAGACAGAAAAQPGAPSAAPPQKQVLVLYATRRDAQIVAVAERELPQIIDTGLGDEVDFYPEYIDRARFPNPDYQTAFRDFLRTKYKGQRFDLVIAMQDVSLQFIGMHRDALFPDTPIVFFASSPVSRVPNSTGVIARLNLADTVPFALALQPDATQMFVVLGAARDDKAYEATARGQFASFASRLAITYLSGLRTNELESQLRALPPRSLVYYVLVNQDGAGENFNPLDYAERVARASAVPVYSWVDSTLDSGVVGGSLKNQTAQVDAVAQVALRVLKGERADDIDVGAADFNELQADWRALQKWGLSETHLPAGTTVLHREPTVWQRYRIYLLTAGGIVVAQTALIGGMLLQRRRRQHAEHEARRSQAELRASYDRIRDLGARLLTAQDQERARIARELHDDINQQVALLAIDLELLRSSPSQKLAGEALARTESLARSVHDLSHRLHPAKLRLVGLVSGLKGIQQEMAAAGVPVMFTYEHVPAALPPEVTVCVFRVVQEALQNAVKYSGAQEIAVHLDGSPERLRLSIVDRGAGFDVHASWGKGLGLVSMTERVEAVGGSLDIQSHPGAGTRLEVTVPLVRLAVDAHADSA